ncbi:hypothetical protein ABVT39_009957 [Epinephelus coioides]
MGQPAQLVLLLSSVELLGALGQFWAFLSPHGNFDSGASHLHSLADGIVLTPEDCYIFGVMSTPGAWADQLSTEVEHAVLPRISDAVCVMAPSNNLTASKTSKQEGIAFGQYLATVCSIWPTAQVHPSDDMGMPILVESLSAAIKQHLEISAPKPQVLRPVSPKPLPKVVPRVIVVGDVVVPRAPLPEWTSVQSGRKRNHSEHEHGSGSLQRQVVHHVV